MNRETHRFIFIALVLILVPTMVAREAIGHAEEAEKADIGAAGYVTGIYGRIHWVFFVLLIITCYYFRHVSERGLGNPRSCVFQYREGYRGDRVIYQFHRFFYWISFILILAYLVSAAVALPAFISMPGLSILQKTTKFLEFFVGAAFILYLSGCYHLKYVFERVVEREAKPCRGCWKNSLAWKQSSLNDMHGHFFWISIFGIIALHIFFIFGGHVG